MAEEDLDLVVHLGDYIYEGAANASRCPAATSATTSGPRRRRWTDYRQRLAQYRTDSDLQAAHAALPWIVTWDDHEVDNNYAGDVAQDDQPQQAFRARRAAAYQAYWEHMPLPPRIGPAAGRACGSTGGSRSDAWRSSTSSTPAQYRTDQPCGDKFAVDCPGRAAPTQTITGPEQEAWLLDGLERSAAQWNVIAQQVFMAQLDLLPGPPRGYNVDVWDGYVASRDRLHGRLRPASDAEPRRAHRRHPLQLGGRPDGQLRRPELGHGRHRVRRHVDQLRRRRLRLHPERQHRPGRERDTCASTTASGATSAAL